MIPNTGSLQNIKVIDLSRVLGGPYCTQILGDHGADVLKIEPPQGDETRGWGPPFKDGVSSYFTGLNRNKTGRVMDLNQSAMRDELWALLADADVLVENFKTGTLEKWGLGFDALMPGSRAWCTAGSAAMALTARWVACQGMTRPFRRSRAS